MTDEFELVIEHGNVLTFAADVLVLKHAHFFYGADFAVADALMKSGVARDRMTPTEGGFRFLDSRSAVAALQVLFVGVPDLLHFD